MFLEGMSYGAGAAIYAVSEQRDIEVLTDDIIQFRIPERWRPGRFDIWGASHQIFHVCAVLGAALHYRGLVKGLDYSHSPVSRKC